MPRQTNGPKKPPSRIMAMSRRQHEKTRANFGLPPNKQFTSKKISIGHLRAKIVNNSAAKGASKSNHVSTLKGKKQPSVLRSENRLISVEKQKDLPRSRVNGKDRSEETRSLKRKREVNDASRPTDLKAMPWLVPKTTDRLGHYSDSSFRPTKRASSDKDISSATKLEFSNNMHMVPKHSCTTEGNDRQDESVIDRDKENVKFVEYHEGDTMTAKCTLDSTLSNINCNSGTISSHPFGRDLSKFQRDNNSMNLTFKNVEKSGLIGDMGEFANLPNKRKEPLSVENPKALDDDSNVGVRKDEADDSGGGGDLNHVGVEDDTTSILKNDHTKVSVSSCVEQQCCSCLKPIDKPAWSGIFKTDNKKYVSLSRHFSTKSCEKAWNLSKQLPQMVEVKILSRLEVWPKAWEVSTPTGDDIGIYFFAPEMRQDEGLDQLVREVMENDLALQTILGEAEMLIFPSILLPNHHHTFQRKHYLWGVFKRRQGIGALVEEPLHAMGHCEKENQQNLVLDQANHKLPGEEPNQEMMMASVIPLERHMLPPNKSTQEVEGSHLKGPTNKGLDLKVPSEEGVHEEATRVATKAVAFPASHEQINPSMEHTPGKLMGFVVRKTPNVDRIIREIEQEGALVFAMQGEMVGAGSWAGSKATVTQK